MSDIVLLVIKYNNIGLHRKFICDFLLSFELQSCIYFYIYTMYVINYNIKYGTVQGFESAKSCSC